MENPKIKITMAKNANVSIWLDSFNDIYSDFDSRSLNDRTLSDDFIHEIRKMAIEKPDGKIDLQLLIPAGLRNSENESIIIKRLHNQFRQTSTLITQEKRKFKKRGIFMALTGFVLMILAAYLSLIENHSFLIKIFRVILEPACWFLVWTGLDQLYNTVYKKNPDHDFNLRMIHARISFQSY